MEENKEKKSLSLIDRHSTYKLIIPELVQKKIREWCYNFPTKEWSGTLFYTVEGAFEDGSLVFTCRDIYISDIGSQAYTEFDHTADIVSYQAQNDLLDCFCGLCHSHNSMATWFSGTDRNTLVEEGMSMPHFLSLIVNNAGTYTAKVTRRVKLETAKISYPTFGGELKSEDAEITVNEYLEAFPLEIDIQEDTSIRDEVAARIKEIEAEKKARTPIILTSQNSWKKQDVGSYRTYGNWGDSKYESANEDCDEVLTSPKSPTKEIVQPSLFSGKEVDGSWINIEVPEELAKRLLRQLVTGSITSGYGDFDMEKWCQHAMEKAFLRRFPDPQDLENWLDLYTEFLTWYTVWEEVEDVDNDMIAKAVASKLLDMCEALPSNKVLKAIMDKLEEFTL